MANYLANIAARTFNPTPEVRPRLQGRFDPPAAHLEKPIDRAEDRSEPRFIQVQTVREIADPQSPSPPDQNKQPIENEFRSNEPRSNNNLTESRAEIREVSSEPAPLAVPRESQTSVSIQPSQSVAIQPRPSSNDDQTSLRTIRDDQVVDRAKQPDGDDLQSAQTTSDDSGNREESGKTVHVERVIDRETRTIVTEKTIASGAPTSGSKDTGVSDKTPARESSRNVAKPPAVLPRITPRRETDARQSVGQDKLRQSESTIHVTIGRIEVRAVQPPPAAAKSRQSQPVMNLDEYLRQRSQGGAR